MRWSLRSANYIYVYWKIWLFIIQKNAHAFVYWMWRKKNDEQITIEIVPKSSEIWNHSNHKLHSCFRYFWFFLFFDFRFFVITNLFIQWIKKHNNLLLTSHNCIFNLMRETLPLNRLRKFYQTKKNWKSSNRQKNTGLPIVLCWCMCVYWQHIPNDNQFWTNHESRSFIIKDFEVSKKKNKQNKNPIFIWNIFFFLPFSLILMSFFSIHIIT